jgi:hypothetical protein
MVIRVACYPGGMAEWFKAAVLKTVERKLRGFESYSLRQSNCCAILLKIFENFSERWPSRLKALAC